MPAPYLEYGGGGGGDGAPGVNGRARRISGVTRISAKQPTIGVSVAVVLTVAAVVVTSALLPSVLAAADAEGAPTVTDAASGAVFVGALDGVAESFRGIRYGTIPARFAPAEEASYERGQRYNASAFGARCFQEEDGPPNPSQPPLSEDCLHLNIWRPGAAAAAAEGVSPLLPVALFIHGGGFTSGSGSDWSYNGSQLAQGHGLVYVSINYRLGPLGYLCVDAACTGGMNGMADQILALQWVQTHIASFGGDPAAVSIFGQSAGGSSVCELAVSPLAAGLFRRALVESGPCIGTFAPANASVCSASGREWLGMVGATSLAQLQDTAAFPMDVFTWGSLAVFPCFGDPAGPLPQSPYSLYASGQVHAEAVVFGANTFDGSGPYLLEGSPLTTRAEYDAQLSHQLSGLTPAEVEVVVHLYDPDTHFNGSLDASFVAILGDLVQYCPARVLANMTARSLAATGGAGGGGNAYFYLFGHLYPRDISLAFGVIPENTSTAFPSWGPTYASHIAEVVFVFGNTFGPGRASPTPHDVPFTTAEKCLHGALSGLWASFFKTGTPAVAQPACGGSGGSFPAWPAVQPSGSGGGAAASASVAGMVLGVDSHALRAADERAAKCAALWPHGITA